MIYIMSFIVLILVIVSIGFSVNFLSSETLHEHHQKMVRQNIETYMEALVSIDREPDINKKLILHSSLELVCQQLSMVLGSGFFFERSKYHREMVFVIKESLK